MEEYVASTDVLTLQTPFHSCSFPISKWKLQERFGEIELPIQKFRSALI